MVPRILHAWWGGPPIPDHLAAYLDRWCELHPAWTFWLWTPETTPLLRHQELYDSPEVYSPKSHVWQWKSDLARYEILYWYGGVYIDADLEPLRPIDDLANTDGFIAREDHTFVNNAFLGFPARSSFMRDVLHGLHARVRARPRDRSNKQLGAHYLTTVLRRHPEITVLPRELVYPFHWSELHERARAAPDAFTRHHWHHKTTQQADA